MRRRGHSFPDTKRRVFDPVTQDRRVFTKLLKDEDAVVSSIYQATSFIRGMGSFKSKAELLSQL